MSTTFVAFDVGNTSVKGAICHGKEWQQFLRVPARPPEALYYRLTNAFKKSAPTIPSGVHCVVSSVNADANEPVTTLWCQVAGARPQFFGSELPIPIRTRVAEPEEVGTDRLLCALGGLKTAGAPCIVVGTGTAVTVDIVDKTGCFIGGSIAAGLRLSARALHNGTTALPLVELSRPERAIGANTEEALRSGIYHSWHAGIQRLICLLRKESGCEDAPVLITGSDAALVLPLDVEGRVEHAPDLIFAGMAAAMHEGA